jgi:apolipoprotein N-acyltransferase
MTISFPFTGSLTFLVFFSWLPLLIVEDSITSARYRSGKVFIHAYITFITFNIGTTWWIWNASPGGAIMAFVLNSLLMALAFQVFHLTKKKIGSNYAILCFISIWTAFEYLHFRWELSWPWLSFGNYFSITPSIVQWYSFTGIFGGTIWVLATNLLAFQLFKSIIIKKINWKIEWKKISALAILLLIPIIISLLQYSTYEEAKKPIEVAVLQPNIDPIHDKFTQPIDIQIKRLCNLADRIKTPNTDIIIAPETAISQGFYEEEITLYPFYKYIKKRKENWGKATFFTGASTARFFEKRHSRASIKLEGGPGFIESYNTSLLIKSDGTHEFLHKSKLVLGVEKIPFSDWLPFLEELSIQNGGTSGTLGVEKEPNILQNEHLTFAPLICYESIYGDFCAEQCRKGAEAIFVITNDGWWGDTPGYKQHMSFSRLRAIENRRSVARSANTGISCIINQKGDVIQKTSWWKETALLSKINLNQETTLYSRTGDILGKLALYLAIALISFSLFQWSKPYFSRNS